MRLLPYGDRGVLAELADTAQVHALYAAVRAAGIGVDAVPGWRTLLVTGPDVAALTAAIGTLRPEAFPIQAPRLYEIPVAYDGADLAAVAARAGLDVPGVISAHSGVDYTVGFLGFAGGFPYLAGLPAALHGPRRSTPRMLVPAGSVAITGDVCGIYPTAAPGGWQLLGHTAITLFDLAATPPALLAPGDRVRFLPLP